MLLDLGLPDASGLEGLRRLLRRTTAIALLVLTGLADEHRGAEAVAAGAQDYLVKGQVDGQLLTRAIRYAIGARAGSRPPRGRCTSSSCTPRRTPGWSAACCRSPLIAGAGGPVRRPLPAAAARLLLGGDFYDAVATPTAPCTS